MNSQQLETQNLAQVVDFIRHFNHHRRDKTYDDRYIYEGISWQEYQQLLNDLEEVVCCRISYENALLEIMSPGKNHELIKELTGLLIVAFCDVKEIDYLPFGSTTLKNQSKQVGKEPDISYAIGEDNEAKEIPDLAVEVNYSSGGVDDLAIYAALGVKEVWLWEKDEQLDFYILENGGYTKVSQSTVLPSLKAATVCKYVQLMQEKTPRIGKQEFITEIKK